MTTQKTPSGGLLCACHYFSLTWTISTKRTERTARRRNHRAAAIRTHSLLFHTIPTSLENDASSIIPKRYFFARNKTVAFLPNAPVASIEYPGRVFIAKWTKYMGVQNKCLKIHLKSSPLKRGAFLLECDCFFHFEQVVSDGFVAVFFD